MTDAFGLLLAALAGVCFGYAIGLHDGIRDGFRLAGWQKPPRDLPPTPAPENDTLRRSLHRQADVGRER